MAYLHLSTDDGESIPVTRLGDGLPIVMLHGWTSNQLTWLPYGEALSKQYSLYCWTARGHGSHGSQTNTPVTLERMAQDLRHLMVQNNMTRVVLLGHSMGALTVWEYIRQFGCNRLAGVCLLDQSPRLLNDDSWRLGIYGDFDWQDNHRFVAELKANFAEAVLQLGANGTNSHVTRSYQQNTPGIQALRNYLKSLHPAPLIQCWENLVAADYRSVLPTISVPTLLIHGNESQFYSPAVAYYLENAIPNAILHLYEGADHFPQIWQKARFIQDVRRFVEDIDQ